MWELPRLSTSNNPKQSRTTSCISPQQIRNRKANRRQRINRYRYEIVRHIYRLFNVTKVKRILKSMNIYYRNFKIVRGTLVIGVKNKQTKVEVEQFLHNRILTEEHYNRLYPKNKQAQEQSK